MKTDNTQPTTNNDNVPGSGAQLSVVGCRSSRGFTLIETLVATFVLITAIVGPLSIVAKGFFFANYTRDQVTAFYLAQEAIEFIRSKRDNVTLAGSTWATFKANPGTSNPPGIRDCLVANNPNGCSIDAKWNTIAACGSTCEYLRQDSAGLYNYQDGNETPFRRTIKMYYEPSGDPNANELRIEVEMLWANGTLTKSFVLKESVFNWQ
ncbi:MAG: prepilin-type N-terminal cleavage/methylation domain-containing protein [bacterium]|nr:prepilin-type N-terminal cleavage/methylation domain-containing protein [bacterium]